MDELEALANQPFVETPKEPEEPLEQTLRDVVAIASIGVLLFGAGAAFVRDKFLTKP